MVGLCSAKSAKERYGMSKVILYIAISLDALVADDEYGDK